MAATARRNRSAGPAAAALLATAAALASLPAAFVGPAARPAARPAVRAGWGGVARGLARAARGGEEQDGGPLEVGQKVKGVVKGIRSFGAFLDVGAEEDALLHISQIADARVDDIYDYLEEGQEVDVWVKSVRIDGKVDLTRIEENAKPREPVNLSPFIADDATTWHSGVVKRVLPFGAVVEVTLSGGGATGEGLVHVSQIKDEFVANVADEVEVGKEVRVRVLSVDEAAGRISLSMREPAVQRVPVDLTPFETVAPETWLEGKVESITPFGAFVAVAPPGSQEPARGLVHVTQISDGFVESIEDVVSVGDDVKVRVVSVDAESRKLGLSMLAARSEEEDA